MKERCQSSFLERRALFPHPSLTFWNGLTDEVEDEDGGEAFGLDEEDE